MVESPVGSLVNGQPACARHVEDVRKLRSRIHMADHEPEAWAVVQRVEARERAEREAAEAREFAAIAAAYRARVGARQQAAERAQ